MCGTIKEHNINTSTPNDMTLAVDLLSRIHTSNESTQFNEYTLILNDVGVYLYTRKQCLMLIRR